VDHDRWRVAEVSRFDHISCRSAVKSMTNGIVGLLVVSANIVGDEDVCIFCKCSNVNEHASFVDLETSKPSSTGAAKCERRGILKTSPSKQRLFRQCST